MKTMNRWAIGLLAFYMLFNSFIIPVHATGKGLETVDGKVYYRKSNGKIVKNQFVKVKTSYYYFGKKGVAYKGLKKVKDDYYYFDKKYRRVQNKTVKIKDKKYYFSKNGKAIRGAVKVGKAIWVSTKKGWLTKNITSYAKEEKDFDAFIEVAGKPLKAATMDSCYNDIAGKDGIYTYSNFKVYTFEVDDVRTITFVQ